jgi:hypothetical protein
VASLGDTAGNDPPSSLVELLVVIECNAWAIPADNEPGRDGAAVHYRNPGGAGPTDRLQHRVAGPFSGDEGVANQPEGESMKPADLATPHGVFNLQILRSMLEAVGNQCRWLDNLSNWTLGAAGVYIAILLGQFDKLHSHLPGSWKQKVVVGITLSISFGVLLKIATGFAGFVLSLTENLQRSLVPLLTPIEEAVRKSMPLNTPEPEQFSRSYNHLMTLMSAPVEEFINTVPFFARGLARFFRRLADKDILVMLKIAARIYYYGEVALLMQVTTLAFAFLGALWHLKY